MTPDGRVTVLIPTMCVEARRTQLHRSIQSALKSGTSTPKVTVIVNGPSYSAALLEDVRSLSGVTVIEVAQASLPNALVVGRESVTTEYFCFLDDDDELIPGTLDRRVAHLQQAPANCFAIADGFRCAGQVKSPVLASTSAITADPYRELLSRNWLPSCGGLYRTNEVPSELLRGVPSMLEWTWLAQSLLEHGLTVMVLVEPCYLIHVTEGSLSLSLRYVEAQPDILRRMHARCSRSDLRPVLRRKLAAAWFDVAYSSLEYGSRSRAIVALGHSMLISTSLNCFKLAGKIILRW